MLFVKSTFLPKIMAKHFECFNEHFQFFFSGVSASEAGKPFGFLEIFFAIFLALLLTSFQYLSIFGFLLTFADLSVAIHLSHCHRAFFNIHRGGESRHQSLSLPSQWHMLASPLKCLFDSETSLLLSYFKHVYLIVTRHFLAYTVMGKVATSPFRCPTSGTCLPLHLSVFLIQRLSCFYLISNMFMLLLIFSLYGLHQYFKSAFESMFIYKLCIYL